MTTSPFRRIDSAVIERFAKDWQVVTDGHADRALVALSGGPDSSALLLLMAAIGVDAHAATVDHGIRPASAAEAVRAAALAVACGVPHSTLSGVLPERVGTTANLSARARALRYRLLAEHATAVGACWIVTAHHADDQLETMVMRLGRGAGLRGLAVVRARQGAVVRPLLGWRRAELGALVAGCGVTAVDDPSNVDERFDRARVRKRLAGVDWLDPLAAARSAAALGQAEDAIAWTVERLAGERCRFGEGAAALRAAALPAELRRRLVERCLVHVDPGIGPRGAEVGRVIERLADGREGTLAGVRYGISVDDGEPWWTFRQAPPHRAHRSA